jgi:hypothetical protein
MTGSPRSSARQMSPREKSSPVRKPRSSHSDSSSEKDSFVSRSLTSSIARRKGKRREREREMQIFLSFLFSPALPSLPRDRARQGPRDEGVLLRRGVRVAAARLPHRRALLARAHLPRRRPRRPGHPALPAAHRRPGRLRRDRGRAAPGARRGVGAAQALAGCSPCAISRPTSTSGRSPARRGSAGRRWAHSSELEDPTPWLSGGELLLTTGLPLDGPASQREYVRRLDAAGVAGLGLGWASPLPRCPGRCARPPTPPACPCSRSPTRCRSSRSPSAWRSTCSAGPPARPSAGWRARCSPARWGRRSSSVGSRRSGWGSASGRWPSAATAPTGVTWPPRREA